jgi:hypothetical protein
MRNGHAESGRNIRALFHRDDSQLTAPFHAEEYMQRWAPLAAEKADIFPLHRRHDAEQVNVMATQDELTNARLETVEARTDLKISRLEGKLDLVLSKLDDQRADNRTLRTNQWVVGFGLAALIVALVALGPSFFGLGTQMRDIINGEIQEQMTRQPPSKSER